MRRTVQGVSMPVILAVVALLGVASNSRAALVDYWALDGNGIDSVGGRNLTFQGTTAFSDNTPAGFAGQSLSLTGAGSGIYDVTGADSLGGAFTVAAWVNPANTTNTLGIFGTRSPVDDSFDEKLLANHVHGDIGNGASWFSTSADAALVYQPGTWYHIAYVVTGTGYTIYVNGISVGSGTYAAGTPLLFDANHDIQIGATGFPGELFNGLIDDVRVYDTALSQSEVLALTVPPGGSGVPLPPAIWPGLITAVLLGCFAAGRRHAL
jgi:hypothetical protein